MLSKTFATRLTLWQQQYGRHNLPWQQGDAYRVWLSEIMLQQTQVKSVLDYYPRFLARFPDVFSLAHAAQEEVLALWSGLGYYSRARNLHKAAQMIVQEFGGQFPAQRQQLERLPGVGRSTAAAIAAFVFAQRESILDGNVKRVLTRCFGIEGFPSDKAVEQTLWQLAESLLPQDPSLMSSYTQGLMDLGATLCRRSQPDCPRCPMLDGCVAAQQGRTAQLPQRKPKKTIPTKHTVMLLLCYGDKIWLERRPPSGIWGGLLSLPEFDSSFAASAWLEALGLAEVLPAWPEFEHVFTHYRLLITPLPANMTQYTPQSVKSVDGQWWPLSQAADAGVPAPVKRLLARLS